MRVYQWLYRGSLLLSTMVYSLACSKSNSGNSQPSPPTQLKADFNVGSPNYGADTTIINFVNASTNATSYRWYFGNSDSSTQTNPVEKYSLTQAYSVKLIAYGPTGIDSVTKQVSVTVKKSAAKQIVSFAFLKSNNPTLGADITGTVYGNKISATVLTGFSTSLIPSFVLSPKSTASVSSHIQKSDTTANDFSETVEYDIQAEDGTKSSYFVDVQRSSFPEMDAAMTNFMTTWQVPGVSLAIIKDDKLVYMNSYGMGDQEDQQPTNNANLFRIGSISKLITRIGIQKLVDQGKLSYNQTVFATNGVLGFDFGTPVAGSTIPQITINELINHTSGWAYNPYGEPLGWTTDQMIRDMVTDSTPEYLPGDTAIYLSFGYEVLGRVLQKISGLDYNTYCQEAIFQNCQINDMVLGGTTLADRKPNEVKYYNSIYTPYRVSIELEKWPAAAGWLASAKDLAKFITRIDGDATRGDILSFSNIAQSGLNGWWEWDGSLEGTTASLARIDNDFEYAIIMNHDIEGDGFTALRQVVPQVIHARTNWPAIDLF